MIKPNVRRACQLMVLSAFLFSAMQAVIGLTADTIPVFEQVFFRNLFAGVIAYGFTKKEKVKFSGDKKNIKILMIRSLTGCTAMIALFYAAGNANQGDVTTLFMISPFLTVLLARVFLREKIKGIQIIAMLIAFIGGAIVAGPKFSSNFLPIFAVICAALLSAVAYTSIAKLKGREHPWFIILVFSSISTIVCFPLMASTFVLPSVEDFLLLLLIGVFAAGGQIALTYAYALGPATQVSVYNYSGILFSTALGYIILDQRLDYTSYLGASLVICAGVVLYLKNKNKSNESQHK